MGGRTLSNRVSVRSVSPPGASLTPAAGGARTRPAHRIPPPARVRRESAARSRGTAQVSDVLAASQYERLPGPLGPEIRAPLRGAGDSRSGAPSSGRSATAEQDCAPHDHRRARDALASLARCAWRRSPRPAAGALMDVGDSLWDKSNPAYSLRAKETRWRSTTR